MLFKGHLLELHLTFRDRQCWRPLISQDVEADGSVAVDVWVVDFCGESDLGRLEWVVCREVDVKEEDTSGKGRISWSHDCCLPLEHVVASRTGTAGRRWVTTEVGELLEFGVRRIRGRYKMRMTIDRQVSVERRRRLTLLIRLRAIVSLKYPNAAMSAKKGSVCE